MTTSPTVQAPKGSGLHVQVQRWSHSLDRRVRQRYPGRVKDRDDEEIVGAAGRPNSTSLLPGRDTTPLLRLEGYQYDLAADFLTAHVVYVSAQNEIERAWVEVPICDGARRLIDETLKVVGEAITQL